MVFFKLRFKACLLLFLMFSVIAYCSEGVSHQVNRELASYIKSYSDLGNHMTGSVVDKKTGVWLKKQLQSFGYQPVLYPYHFKRIIPIKSVLKINHQKYVGFPTFDGGFTSEKGIHGRLCLLGQKCDIVVMPIPSTVLKMGGDVFHNLRAEDSYKAIVAITLGGSPGLALLDNVGPKNSKIPVLQVSSLYQNQLLAAAEKKEIATLILSAKKKVSTAYNIVAKWPGMKISHSPILVTTPVSAWTNAADERGAGIACWLMLAKKVQQLKPERPVYFIGFSSHELGFDGFPKLYKQKPGIFKGAIGWLHIGADLGGYPKMPLRIATNHIELTGGIRNIAHQAGIKKYAIDNHFQGEPGIAMKNDQLQLPIVLIASAGNRYFHMEKDRWPHAVNMPRLQKDYLFSYGLLRGFLDKQLQP